MFALLSAARGHLSPAENKSRHLALRREVEAHNWESITCQGVYTGQDGVTVHEASLLIPCPATVSFLEIVALARRFEQESILIDNGGQGTLVFCADGSVQNLGRRTPGIADNYTDTPLGAFHYA